LLIITQGFIWEVMKILIIEFRVMIQLYEYALKILNYTHGNGNFIILQLHFNKVNNRIIMTPCWLQDLASRPSILPQDYAWGIPLDLCPVCPVTFSQKRHVIFLCPLKTKKNVILNQTLYLFYHELFLSNK
jgi:hypothetical protein